MSYLQSSASLFESLSKALEISTARYESAERSYHSIGDWLRRESSALASFDVNVYLQGSFRLGTAIRPVSGEENYDLDMVCEVRLDKAAMTQAQFQDLVGSEIVAYAERHGMERPEKWDRCWTLNYSEDARFHIDFLPSVPDGIEQSRILNERGFSASSYSQSSIAITDKKHHSFRMRTRDWPVSNPNGYFDWFLSRMNQSRILNERDLYKGQVDVAEIPVFKRQSPLQAAIKLLKRHRDMMFIDEPEAKPSSIVLTTLAARAYQGEPETFGAINSILTRMNQFILRDPSGGFKIENPSDPRENFADAWAGDQSKSKNFNEWLETAQADFSAAASATDAYQLAEVVSPRLGRNLVENALSLKRSNSLTTCATAGVPSLLIDAPHKRPPRWPLAENCQVRFLSVTATRKGFRTREIRSGDAIESGSELFFKVQTTAQRPFKVFWQVVNTGEEAKSVRQLRGGFDVGEYEEGTLKRTEQAKYFGVHSIECFIVQNNVCVGRSGIFIVPIE